MSCESRHRAIITTLLTLAGRRDTVDADTVMDVGVGKRYRRGELPTPDAAVPVSLHADAQHALAITGHSDHATPAWVAALIDRLHTAAERGNRRAFLTLRWLTDGWDDVTPRLTESDRGWLLTAKRVGIQVPPAWETWLPPIRPTAVVGRLLAAPVRDAVVLTDLLDALIGIDDVPPAAVQTVTPLQVLRFLLGGSFPSRTDLQQVLRAVLENAPVVRKTTTFPVLHTVRMLRPRGLLVTLIGCAVHAHPRSVEQVGRDTTLAFLADRIQGARSPSIDPAALHDPSPSVIKTIIDTLRNGCTHPTAVDGVTLTALIHIWSLNGRDDAVEQVIRGLAQILPTCQNGSFIFSTIVPPIMAGVICPPYGDDLVAHLASIDHTDRWPIVTADAVYAAACHRIGHEPTIGGIADRLHVWQQDKDLSPISVLAIGRERALLLPALRSVRDPTHRHRRLLDCIDAMDMIDMVGGDPQALQSVLTEVVTEDGDAVDPWIVVRLAASRCGQTILPYLPTAAPPPVRPDGATVLDHARVIGHLVSPWWATAPPHLQEWRERAFGQIATSGSAWVLDRLPPLYPTVLPQAAVIRPDVRLVARAIAGSQWDDLPETDRRTCLATAFQYAYPEDILQIITTAASDTSVQDVATALSAVGRSLQERGTALRQTIRGEGGLSDTDIHALQRLIGLQPRRSA